MILPNKKKKHMKVYKIWLQKKISRLLCVEWSRSHAFLSQSCPLMGSLALAWVAYLCAPQCLLLRCKWVRLIGSCSWSLIVDQLSLFELVLPWSPDFLKHLIWPSVFDWLCVSFRGWTFLQFCQPFGRGRPKTHSKLLAIGVRPLAGRHRTKRSVIQLLPSFWEVWMPGT